MHHRLGLWVGLLATALPGTAFANPTVTSSGYPYESNHPTCMPAPTLKPKDIADIAEQAGLFKAPNGQWEIEYGLGAKWAGNPLHDHCIWIVRTSWVAAPANPSQELDVNTLSGEMDAATASEQNLLYISDQTKQWWFAKKCAGDWCKPGPEGLPTAK